LSQQDPEARRFAGAAGERIDDGKKSRITRNANIHLSNPAGDIHGVCAVLEPVCGDLFVKSSVARGRGEPQNEKEPQAKARSKSDNGAGENSPHQCIASYNRADGNGQTDSTRARVLGGERNTVKPSRGPGESRA
jgi:hypothetical protein